MDFEDFNATFSRSVKDRRVAKKLSQRDLAAMADMPKLLLHRIENGLTNPRLFDAAKIAAALDTSLYEMAPCDNVLPRQSNNLPARVT